MTERTKDDAPFDERAALNQLEQFRADIERYREQRNAVAGDFEAFVRAFPSPDDVFPAEQPTTPPVSTRTDTSAVRSKRSEPATPPLPPLPPRPARAQTLPSSAKPAQPDPRVHSPAADSLRPASSPAPPIQTPARTGAPSSTRSKRPLLVAVLLLALVAGGFAFWNSRRAGPQPTGAANPPAVETTPAVPAPSASAPSAPAPVTEPPPATGSEITTLRPVWVRVIADGERVVERELPAGTRVPFDAEKTIVIRTGDAGAVQLKIRGEDHGALGRAGEVVTRTFTVPAGPPR